MLILGQKGRRRVWTAFSFQLAYFEIILFGPSAIFEAPVPPTNRCNAFKSNIREASPELIAYITILLRFCLSSEETYSNGTFAYTELYDAIRKQFQDVNFEEMKKDIIHTWNRELFPQTGQLIGLSENVMPGLETMQGYLRRLEVEKSAALQVAKVRLQLNA